MASANRKKLLLAAAGIGLGLAARALARKTTRADFRGKTVLITGGSRGLGLVLARTFADEGASLVICARDADDLERAREDLTRRGASVLAVPCDVTDRQQVEALVQAARERFGRIDVLVNNAGRIQVGPMEVQTLEDYEASLNTHFWGPLYTILAVLPEMRERREGRIVNISSIGGKISVPHMLPYSAGKFALVGLSEGLRAELAKDGIVVTTVTPGLMRTGSPLQATFKGQHEKEYTWFAISDSLPVLSISATRAAREIVAACRRGDATLTLTLPARLAIPLHGLFPGITADLLGVVNRLLPAPGGVGIGNVTGVKSQTPASETWAAPVVVAAQETLNNLA
jgi:NAD(P)-dependent dehydrogenase (short-subunit alcohol dehydrogenase family)